MYKEIEFKENNVVERTKVTNDKIITTQIKFNENGTLNMKATSKNLHRRKLGGN